MGLNYMDKLFQKLNSIEETILLKKEDIQDIEITGIKGDKGDDGKQGIKGEKGDKGERGEKGDKGISGLNGKDGIDGTNGKDGTIGKDGSPDTPDEVTNKVNLGKPLIKKERIEGLTDIENNLKHNLYTGISETRAREIIAETPSSGGTPASPTNSIQYNSAGAFGGSANLTFDGSLTTHTNDSLGSTQNNTNGVALINNTAATAILQQDSPALRFHGNGWKTNATAGSQPIDFRLYIAPANSGASTTNANGSLNFDYSVNSASYVPAMQIWSNGRVGIGVAGPFLSSQNVLQVVSVNIAGGSLQSNGSAGTSSQFLVGGSSPAWVNFSTVATAGITGSNGIAITGGNNVTLGGTLTGTTTIDNDNNTFTIGGSGEGITMFAGQTGIGDVTLGSGGNVFYVNDGASPTGAAYYDNPTHDGRFGINTTTPESTLHVKGSVQLPYLFVNADAYVITESDYTLSVNNGGSNWGIELPAPSVGIGRIYIIKRYDDSSTGDIAITATGGADVQNPETGAFSTSYTLNNIWGKTFQWIMYQSNGDRWEAIK